VNITERVKSFLCERDNVPYCDDCIKHSLGLKWREQAQSVTGSVAGTESFIRSKGLCFDCGKDKLVIRSSK
jgi:hypothetical protein